MNLYLRTKYLRPKIIGSLFHYSTTSIDVTEQNEQLFDDSENSRVKEAEIEKKRNISRLSPAHQNIVNGRRPYETPKCLAHLTVKYHRKMYGIYGSASGVNPSLCWLTKKDIQEKLEYESVAFPYTIKEMMDAAAQKRREDQEKIEKRDKEIFAKMGKLEQWKKELIENVAKKTAEAQKAKEKKERLVEEVRRHFGFKLDPRDEKFQEMLVKREKEQKKAEKMAKREAKEKLVVAKLQQKNMELEASK